MQFSDETVMLFSSVWVAVSFIREEKGERNSRLLEETKFSQLKSENASNNVAFTTLASYMVLL